MWMEGACGLLGLVVDRELTWDLKVVRVVTARSSLETEKESIKRGQEESGEVVGNH